MSFKDPKKCGSEIKYVQHFIRQTHRTPRVTQGPDKQQPERADINS